MFSLSNFLKRVGLGGGLVPFFKCVLLYFAVAETGEAGAGPSAGAAAAKCAPVLSLLAVVLLLPAPPHAAGDRPDPADQPDQDCGRWWYRALVGLGLALSALGDVLLEWPQHFVAGMAAFGGAHACYSCAFWIRGRWGRGTLVLAPLLYLCAGAYTLRLPPPAGLRTLVLLYAALLATMTWRALATLPAPLPRRPAPPRPALRDLYAPGGALLFLLSDAILGHSLFAGPVPYKQVLVMSTYYLAQLGITLSALLPPAPTPPAPAHAHAD